MPTELPPLRLVGQVPRSHRTRRWTSVLASYTWQGDLDMTATIEAVGMNHVKRTAEAIVAMSQESPEPPPGGEDR